MDLFNWLVYLSSNCSKADVVKDLQDIIVGDVNFDKGENNELTKYFAFQEVQQLKLIHWLTCSAH